MSRPRSPTPRKGSDEGQWPRRESDRFLLPRPFVADEVRRRSWPAWARDRTRGSVRNQRAGMRSATQVLRVAVVNDFELIVRGVAEMLAPFRDRVLVVELDVGTNPASRVDIALFDTYGHARSGVDRVRSLATDPRVGAVAVYTWILPPGQVDAVLTAGARGVLSKSTPADTLVDALTAIDVGDIVVSPVFSRPRERIWPGHDLGLTVRESEVAAFLAEGLSNHEIADALYISEHTVKSHLKAIFQKTGAASRTQVIARLAADPNFRRIRRAG